MMCAMKAEPQNVQIRNVPPDLWRRVKVRAVTMGISVRQYVIDALTAYERKDDEKENR